MRTFPSPSSILELGAEAMRALSGRMTFVAESARSQRSADVMAYGIVLVVSLSFTGWGLHALSIGVDHHGAGLLIAVGMGLLGFSCRGLWTLWTAARRSMPPSTH